MNKIKDLKIYKKLLALLSAGVMMVTSLPALAEGETNNNTNDTSITMIDEEPEQLTFNKYLYYCENVFQPKIRPFLKFPHIVYTQIYPIFYYSNYMNCRDIKDEIEDYGLIFFWDLTEAKHFMDQFILSIADVNIKAIKKKADINKLFDYSFILLNLETQDLIHNSLYFVLKKQQMCFLLLFDGLFLAFILFSFLFCFLFCDFNYSEWFWICESSTIATYQRSVNIISFAFRNITLNGITMKLYAHLTKIILDAFQRYRTHFRDH